MLFSLPHRVQEQRSWGETLGEKTGSMCLACWIADVMNRDREGFDLVKKLRCVLTVN